MRHYDEILNEQRGPFYVVVSKTWEDVDVGDRFDGTCYDIQDMRDQINSGDLDWFMLRTQVFYEGVELACEYLGGCLYEDAQEVLRDGLAEDQIYSAMQQARRAAADYELKFQDLDLVEVDKLLA
jgi:hypothetical protein